MAPCLKNVKCTALLGNQRRRKRDQNIQKKFLDSSVTITLSMSGLGVHDSSTQWKQREGEIENGLLKRNKIEAVSIHSYPFPLEKLCEYIFF